MKNSLKVTPLQYVAYAIISSVVLTFILQGFTSIKVDSWASALAGIVLVQILQIILQPVFSLVAKIFGLLGILFVSFFGFSVVVWLALEIVPGIQNVSFTSSLVASWIYAAVVALLQWVILAQSDDFFLRQTLKGARNKDQVKTDVPGFVFVQFDGVSGPVFEWQLNAGNLPNIKRLIDAEGYTFESWHTQIPSTTPASQAGILLGSHRGIPAFRWYERKTDQLIVANQTAGAALIEKRLSTGKGLLADGGTSIGNLFSGDAPNNIMVMSKISGDRQSINAMREYTDYFSSLYGFMRVLILSLGEMVKEIYQAQRQRIRNVQPRVSRKGSYILLRAGTNVLLRDLQTTIVVDQMMQGVNSIYVDYLDYDEIAHHAGIARPEALAALTGLDHIAGVLSKASKLTPRPYHVVFVSDHGQSQGQTFKQLNGGQSLEAIIGKLLGTSSVSSSTAPVEQESVARSLLAHESANRGIIGSAAESLSKKYRRKTLEKPVLEAASPSDAEIVVTGSGNLGNVWLKKFSARPSRAQIDESYPGFLDKLLKHRGIGLVIIPDGEDGPVCIDANGQLNLKTGRVKGKNPLKLYQNIRRQDLLEVATDPNAPDIQIVSSMQPSTREVHAFEELVGNHGGIGGWQTEAILLRPKSLKISKRYYEDEKLYGSTTIHSIFLDWLEKAGHRKKIQK